MGGRGAQKDGFSILLSTTLQVKLSGHNTNMKENSSIRMKILLINPNPGVTDGVANIKIMDIAFESARIRRFLEIK